MSREYGVLAQAKVGDEGEWKWVFPAKDPKRFWAPNTVEDGRVGEATAIEDLLHDGWELIHSTQWGHVFGKTDSVKDRNVASLERV